jgi:hypothetical protein
MRGQGVLRTWKNGDPKLFEARNLPGRLVRKWAGSYEFSVPGYSDRYRILYNSKYGIYGWTDDHYVNHLYEFIFK